MSEDTEFYVEGDEVVRVTRTPLSQEIWSDERIDAVREWWDSESRSDWAFLPPSVRILVLECVVSGLGDVFEVITRFQIALKPDLDDQVFEGARDYLTAIVTHDEFGYDLIWEQLSAAVLECAAEATAEIGAGTCTLHEWRRWFIHRFDAFPDQFLETAYDALNEEYDGGLDWEHTTCECCSDLLKPADGIRSCFLGGFYGSFQRMMKLIAEQPEYFDGLEEYDYGVSNYA